MGGKMDRLLGYFLKNEYWAALNINWSSSENLTAFIPADLLTKDNQLFAKYLEYRFSKWSIQDTISLEIILWLIESSGENFILQEVPKAWKSSTKRSLSLYKENGRSTVEFNTPIVTRQWIHLRQGIPCCRWDRPYHWWDSDHNQYPQEDHLSESKIFLILLSVSQKRIGDDLLSKKDHLIGRGSPCKFHIYESEDYKRSLVLVVKTISAAR